MTGTTTAFVALALVGLATSGCGGATGLASKVGAPAEPVTLTLADQNRGPAPPGVLDFAADVQRDSHGAVRIRLVGVPETGNDFELRIVRGTAAGRWNLAWVGGRVLDEVGVTDAAALQVPFLIDNYALERRVVDGPIGARLTREIPRAGVVAVGLLADHMRYLATTGPIRTPSALAGKRMRAWYSAGQVAGWRALHAIPVLTPGTTNDAVGLMQQGRLFGLESDPQTWSGTQWASTIYTVGAPIWPRTIAIIAAPKRFAALPPGTQSLLRTAAAQADRQVLANAVSADAAAIHQICAGGGRVAVLDNSQRASFERAGAVIAGEMARTEPYGALIREIAQLKGSASPQPAPPVPAGCAPGARTAEPVAAGGSAASGALARALRPGTVYRARIDYSVAVTQLGRQAAENNAATYNWQFAAGNHFTLVTQHADYPAMDNGAPATGTFTITGDLIKLHFNPPNQGDEIDRCSATASTVTCQWLSGNDAWTTKMGLGGMTTPLTLVHG
jgi:TRAP-type C4-dicarboxylate transport system substrate-binding protein